MRYIQKNQEPEAFIKWKEQEEDTLEDFYEKARKGQKKADTIWSHLPSNLPPIKEKGTTYYSKKELAEALLQEQGYLCAYCNRPIHNEWSNREEDPLVEKGDTRVVIDHLAPKSIDPRERTFDYGNLLASCKGGEKIPKPRQLYCDAKKGNRPITIHPLMPECEDAFVFTEAGEMIGSTPDANKTVEILGLSAFNEQRKSIIQGYLYDDPILFKTISKDKAKEIIQNLSQMEDGKYKLFCSAVINVLKREILKS